MRSVEFDHQRKKTSDLKIQFKISKFLNLEYLLELKNKTKIIEYKSIENTVKTVLPLYSRRMQSVIPISSHLTWDESCDLHFPHFKRENDSPFQHITLSHLGTLTEL